MSPYPQLSSPDSLVTQLVGWTASSFGVILLSSPLSTMRSIVSARSTLDFADAPYLAGFLCCSCWTIYGLLIPNRLQCLVNNAYGVVMFVGYLYCCIWFHTPTKRRRLVFRILCAAAVITAVAAVATQAQSEDFREQFLGISCIIMNIFLYSSPLAAVSEVLRTKSVEFMPLGLSLATFLTSICWAVYALQVGDLYVALPNNAGVLLGIIQLAIYGMYRRSGQSSECESVLKGPDPATPGPAQL